MDNQNKINDVLEKNMDITEYIQDSYFIDEKNNSIVCLFYIITRNHPSSLNWYRFYLINEDTEEIEFEEIEDKNKYNSLL
jgi:hypothetical protein